MYLSWVSMKSQWMLVHLLFLTGFCCSEIGTKEAASQDETTFIGRSENSSNNLSYKLLRNSGGPIEVRRPHGEDVTPLTNADQEQHPLVRAKRGVCGGRISSSSGVITSPSHPRDYAANTNCTWTIEGSSTERIVLTFTSFNLENCCHCDHVVIYTQNGNVTSPKHGPFCGDKLPGVITTEENYLMINFKTDYAVQKSGFSARYRKEPCGGVFTARNGTITSPQYPQTYPRNKRCIYQIVAPPQHCINLNFIHFELEHQDKCSYDSVQVNSSTHRGTVHKYERSCGSTAPTSITCEGDKVLIEFVSDSSNQYSGFAANFNMVYDECSVKNGGCKHICESNAEGKHSCACRKEFVLHPDDHDCKQENSAGKIVQLSSVAQPNGSLIFSWKWRGGVVPSELSGFYFKAISEGHTFQATLPSTLTNFTAHQLRPYEEYDVRLWPFYKLDGASSEKLGKPITLSVRTPALAPTTPTSITPWPQSAWLGPAEVTLAIYGPVAWNSNPVGYRLRWEPSDAGDLKERIIKFSEFPFNGERSQYDLNISLSLKPGRTYTVFASACGLGDTGESLVGPETSATFGTIPSAPVNLSAQIVDPTCAMLAWESPSPAARHEITVSTRNIRQGGPIKATVFTPTFYSTAYGKNLSNENFNSSQEQDVILDSGGQIVPLNQQASSSMALWTRDKSLRSAKIWLDGNSVTSSSYNLPVCSLIPYMNYKVHIRSCMDDVCSETTSTAFKTSPSSIETPTITRIFSNDTTSIHLEWSLPRREEWLDFGLKFRVRVYKNRIFRLITTTEMALTLTDLRSGTEYQVEVRPSFEVSPGRRKYGKPARAVVSTWPLVPLPPILSTKAFVSSPDVLAVSWCFVNSSVAHVEVATNSSDFVNCKTLPACDEVVLYGWTSSFKAGFVKISGLNPYKTYAVKLRGCNDHGCGDSTAVHGTTGISEPSEPLDLRLIRRDNVTAVLRWKPPLNPAGPLTGYLGSWECVNGTTMAATTTDCCSVILSGLPTQKQECSFSVSAYNVADNGEELHGKPASLTTKWPNW